MTTDKSRMSLLSLGDVYSEYHATEPGFFDGDMSVQVVEHVLDQIQAHSLTRFLTRCHAFLENMARYLVRDAVAGILDLEYQVVAEIS